MPQKSDWGTRGVLCPQPISSLDSMVNKHTILNTKALVIMCLCNRLLVTTVSHSSLSQTIDLANDFSLLSLLLSALLDSRQPYSTQLMPYIL